jgi:hypothetical protein
MQHSTTADWQLQPQPAQKQSVVDRCSSRGKLVPTNFECELLPRTKKRVKYVVLSREIDS